MRVVQSEASKETSARHFARGLAPRVFGANRAGAPTQPGLRLNGKLYVLHTAFLVKSPPFPVNHVKTCVLLRVSAYACKYLE